MTIYKDKQLRVFEAFSGIGAQHMALKELGIDYEIVATSEIDPLAIKAYSNIHCKDIAKEQDMNCMKEYLIKKGIYTENNINSVSKKEVEKVYKASINSKNLGDISLINNDEVPEHDLFTYSFPCQDISSIGRLKGFEENSGTRSSLLWECGKIISNKKPKYLLLENVKNIVTKNNIQNFNKWCDYLSSLGYKNYWKLLDSQNFGVSQRRIRCFMVSILGNENFEMPITNNITPSIYDVFDGNVEINEICPYDELINKIEDNEVKYLDDRDWKMNGILIGNVSSTQRAGRCGIKVITKRNSKLYMRNITPLESWRLMGFKDEDYNKLQSNNEFTKGNVYKFCGNSIVMPVLKEIFKAMFCNNTTQQTINGLSLFANVGIAETYLKESGIDIKVANELLPERADFYRHLYPDCNMICGDIYEKFDEILEEAKKNNCKFLIATPPCQGMSVAGKRDYNDIRNLLIFQVFKMIDKLEPDYVLIENVPQLLDYKFTYNDKIINIKDFINENYSDRYNINKLQTVLAEDYSVPQHRKRAIILMSKTGLWEYPQKDKKRVTVRDVIGNFPSLEANIREDNYKNVFSDNNEKIKKAIAFNKLHYPPTHTWRHIEIMLHTPTGHSAFENEVYYPKKTDGTKVSGYNTTYKRMKWDEPAPTITMANGVVSSQCNVHPGRLNPDGTYSDARVLTICELLKLFTLPLDWNIPEWANENLVRKVIGEGVPPLLIKKIVDNRR